MGVRVVRDPNELTRVIINAWDHIPNKVLETLGETIGKMFPVSEEICYSEEHFIVEESKLEVVMEFVEYIRDCIEDKQIPTLFQCSLTQSPTHGCELFLLVHCQSLYEAEVAMAVESVKWWNEPRPEVEVCLRVWDTIY